MSDPQDREEGEGGAERFFSKQAERKASIRSSIAESAASNDDEEQGSCLTLRILQFLLPCLRNKGVFEPSKGDVFQSHDAEEANYPRSLRILEHKAFEILFITSCVLSIILFLFSEGFLLESRLLWGIMHLVNAVYALGLFSQWLQILIKSKYAKTNHGYMNRDILYTLVSVFPADLIVLVIYTLNDDDDNEDIDESNPIEYWMITVSRINYFLRVRGILQRLAKLEDNLVMGDFSMFMLRLVIYVMFLLHLLACLWNRLACRSFHLKHFLMTPEEARVDVCEQESWIGHLQMNNPDPLLNHPNWHILVSQYLVSLYWAVFSAFRLGAGDITTMLTQKPEVTFIIVLEIISWVFMLVNIYGPLTALFIEGETEKENFLIRLLAIKHYLGFTEVAKNVQDEVYRYYAYIWEKCRGIVHVDLVDEMPGAMKSEVYYDVNKYVMDQMPMLKGLDVALHMALSVYTEHKFFLSGEILFRRGDTACDMYYLVSGHLDILTEDDNHTITTIRSGSIIGEVHLLQAYPHISTVRCGSDCDVLVLSRTNFRSVVDAYPQYLPVLEQRLENRMEQSGLLLALCEKHNTYRKAFKALHEAMEYERRKQKKGMPPSEDGIPSDLIDPQKNNLNQRHSFERVTNILHGGGAFEPKNLRNTDDDLDGLELSEDIQAKLHSFHGPDQADRKGYAEALAAAALSLETDVARAGSLATDLNIPRPPLTVQAPEENSDNSLMSIMFGSRHNKKEDDIQPNCCVIAYRALRNVGEELTTARFMWTTHVILCTLAVFWYYPFQFGFYSNGGMKVDYIFHVTDIFFVLDCIYDMLKIVVTPQRTYETFREIFKYRIKSFYFYLRIFSWLPLEYIIAVPIGIQPPYFYAFKFNRLLLIHKVFGWIASVEKRFKWFTPVMRAFVTLFGGIFFISHFAAIAYKFVLREVVGRNTDGYLKTFYRAFECTTTTGYGDIKAFHNLELAVDVSSLLIGIVTLIYLQAKVTAMMVNNERQRVFFHGVYYGIANFMRDHRFSKSLQLRVKEYYDLQWRAHEGTLPPVIHQTIWDAPASVITKVAICVGQRYLSRIPLFMHASLELQIKFCKVLNHYLIPPGETLLYSNELVRDLYIVAKGYVEVIHQDKSIGIFRQGRYFGLNGLLTGANSAFTYRTVSYCQVLCLTYEDFQKVASNNSKFYIEFQKLEELAEDERQQNKQNKKKKKDKKTSKRSSTPIPTSTNTSSTDRLVYPPQKYIDYIVKISQHFENDNEFELHEDALLTPSEEAEKAKTPALKPKKMRRKKKADGALNSLALVMSECSCKTFHFHFTPYGYPLKIWMIFRLTCAFVATTFAPMQLAIPMNPTKVFVMTLVLDIVAWLGMIVSSRTAYLGDSNQLISNTWDMACHYFKGNFLLDILSSLPADFIAYLVLRTRPNFGNQYHIISFLRLNRMLQAFQLNMFKSQFLEKSIFKSLPFAMLLELLPIMFIGVNLVTCSSLLWACGFTTTGYPVNCRNNDAWVMNGARDLGYITSAQGLYSQPDVGLPYLIGSYWAAQSITFIGFGDIKLGTNFLNRYLAICAICSGIFFMTYVVGKLTSCISRQDDKKMELEQKVVLMTGFMEQHRVSKSCQWRVHEIYHNIWAKTRGMSPREMFAALPPGLKTDVMRQLYGVHFLANPLFEKLDGSGIRMLAGMLREEFFSEGEFLIKFGDLCTDVIFIANGIVTCYNVRGDVMSQLGPGSLIGEVASYFRVHRLYSAVAVQEVNAYVFKKEEFMAFLDHYPDIKGMVEAFSVRHYKEAMQGTRMARNMDYDVQLSYQNEKGSGSRMASVDEEKSITSPSRGSPLSSFELADGTIDKTRNTLVFEDIKPQDYLSKPVTQKWWTFFVTFGPISRDEMGLVHVFQDQAKCNLINFAIHPASRCCQWSAFCLFITALSCCITSYDVTFEPKDRDNVNWPLRIFTYALEIFFIARFFGNFHLAYYDETLELVTDVKMITRRYIRRVDGIWLDIVTCVPFYLMGYLIPGLSEEHVRSVQLLRVILFCRYMQYSDSGLTPGSSSSIQKIYKTIILLGFIFHFYACAWYLVACTEHCVNGSWMQEVINKFRIQKNDPKIEIPTDYRYLLAFYYVTNALTYTGFAEITARTKMEVVMTILMIFTMIFMTGYLIGEMVMCLSGQVAYKIHYQRKLRVLEVGGESQLIFMFFNAPDRLVSLGITSSKVEEVRTYFKLFWCHSKGMQYRNLMKELPYSLRADLAFEIYGPNIRSSRILGKLDENMMRQICAQIRLQLYFPGSCIVRAGDVCNSMYFIKKGEVVILDGNTNAKLCVEILYENECFGEVKVLLPREQYRFSYVARLESEVGILDKAELENILRHQPRLFDELKDKANRVKVKRQSFKDDEEKDKGVSGGLNITMSSLSIKSAVSQKSSTSTRHKN